MLGFAAPLALKGFRPAFPPTGFATKPEAPAGCALQEALGPEETKQEPVAVVLPDTPENPGAPAAPVNQRSFNLKLLQQPVKRARTTSTAAQPVPSTAVVQQASPQREPDAGPEASSSSPPKTSEPASRETRSTVDLGIEEQRRIEEPELLEREYTRSAFFGLTWEEYVAADLAV